MPTPIAGFVADAHIRPRTWDIHGDTYVAFEQVVQYACDHSLQALYGAGDLLDQARNHSEPVTFLYGQLDELRDAAVPFFYIRGNHDWTEPPWPSGHSWAVHADQRVQSLGDFQTYGLDFRHRDKFMEALDRIPKSVDTLVCHQTWGDWMGDIARPQADFANVPHVRTIISGDWHKRMLTTALGKDGQQMVVCSPGATCMQKIDEPSKHYFVVLYDDGRLRHHRLKSRPFLEWPTIASAEDLDVFVSRVSGELTKVEGQTPDLPERIRKPLLRVIYCHDVPNAVQRIERAVLDRVHLSVRELPPASKAALGEKRVRGHDAPSSVRATPLTELHRVLDPDKKPEAYALLARLLQSNDRERELAEWKAEFLGDDT